MLFVNSELAGLLVDVFYVMVVLGMLCVGFYASRQDQQNSRIDNGTS